MLKTLKDFTEVPLPGRSEVGSICSHEENKYRRKCLGAELNLWCQSPLFPFQARWPRTSCLLSLTLTCLLFSRGIIKSTLIVWCYSSESQVRSHLWDQLRTIKRNEREVWQKYPERSLERHNMENIKRELGRMKGDVVNLSNPCLIWVPERKEKKQCRSI